MAHLLLLLTLSVLAIVSFCPRSATKDPGPVVKTKYGAIQGVYVEQGSMFLGIPFAAPPVGDLRWKPPQPPAPWAPGTFMATNVSFECVPINNITLGLGRNGNTSEDCLYLNVFVPMITNTSEKLPVFFWIHGGDFLLGSAMDPLYDGRFLANSTRTVVVAANYRLSALGFLVAGQGEGAATGNYGILDQIAALQWVQDNIAEFGGDKDRVTIFGQSAGAYSVVLHMTLGKSDHLFHRAIAASPPLSLFFKTRLEALLFGDDFARLLNCTPGDMDCMRA
ncbi:crystal protein-like [Branchiostoma floridae]|uniref:Carboxylic ester hydrolase n=1 Tax=Branchiostoma floridae TaxID=7739 RepID=A0A9J7MY96_BRAFL|nr:crystal protein-like [Branchiostoma floridae]